MEGQAMTARTPNPILLIATSILAVYGTNTRACEYHTLNSQQANNRGWSVDPGPASLSKTDFSAFAAIQSLSLNDPAIDNWKLATGATGHSTDTTINNVVNKI